MLGVCSYVGDESFSSVFKSLLSSLPNEVDVKLAVVFLYRMCCSSQSKNVSWFQVSWFGAVACASPGRTVLFQIILPSAVPYRFFKRSKFFSAVPLSSPRSTSSRLPFKFSKLATISVKPVDYISRKFDI